MKMDLNCPAEVWQCDLPTLAYPACTLKLYNLLPDKLMVSVEVTLILLDEKGEEQTRVLYRAHDLKGEPGKTFLMAVPVEGMTAEPNKCEVLFEKIWYDSGAVWRRSRASLTSYTSNVMKPGRELDRLRFVAGDTAVGYPQKQGAVWVCVCGRPNLISDEACMRCHRGRDLVFDTFSKEAVEKRVSERENELDAETRKAREDASRRQAAREQAYLSRRKKRRRVVAWAVGCVLVAGAAYGGVFHLWPYVKYRQAVSLHEKGKYVEALGAFGVMQDYRDAHDYMLSCRLNLAQELMDKGDKDSLEQAEADFKALGGFEDSAERAKQARYLRAGVLVKEKLFGDARELYVSLDDYKDSANKVTECDYLAAVDMLENGDYLAAMDAFAALGDDERAKARWQEAALLRAKALMDQSDWDGALALLSELPEDLADAKPLRQEAHYERGRKLLESGDAMAAGEAFLAAGDWEDAAEQATACVYPAACQAQENGDLAKAAELFRQLPGYEDADERWRQCVLTLSERAMHDLEYKLAQQLLADLPEDDEEAQKLRSECVYRPALASLKKGDFEAAVAGFTQLGDYSDSEKQLNAARYGLAQALEETDPDRAMSLYEALGTYENSARKLRALRYAQAQAAEGAAEWDKAIALYEALEDYQDSARRLTAVRYQQALALLDKGDEDAALAAFEALDDYEDSAEKAQLIRYAKADKLLTDGDADVALAAFEALGDYEDSATRAMQIRYQKASALLESGDADAALAAFEALGDYEDSAARALQIRYEKAEALETEGRYDEAEVAYRALNGYADSAERIPAMRYAQADALLADKQWKEAEALFRALGDYKNAADKVRDVDMSRADTAAAAGDWATAEAIYLALGDYDQAPSRLKGVYYTQAQLAQEAGDQMTAAQFYLRAGDYKDAQAQLKTCMEAYEAPRKDAQALLDQGDAAGAVDALRKIDMTLLPEEYADLPGLYARAATAAAHAAMESGDAAAAAALLDAVPAPVRAEMEDFDALFASACVAAGEALMDAGDEESALLYLARVRTRESIAAMGARKERLLLGRWQDGDRVYQFNPDGTCVLDGEAGYYELDGYNLNTGASPSALQTTHKVSANPTEKLYLRDVRGGESVGLTMSWIGPCDLPGLGAAE